MTRWRRGEADVDRLLADGHLQRVAPADGEAWLDGARRALASAESVAATDATSAYTLAYDAVRRACTALLVQQGLRPTSAGGHIAVERAVIAQFGEGFKPYSPLRRRRNELEYPTFADDAPDAHEVDAAIAVADDLLGAVARLLPGLSPY